MCSNLSYPTTKPIRQFIIICSRDVGFLSVGCVPWYIEFSSVSDNPWKKGTDTCSRVGTVVDGASNSEIGIYAYILPSLRFFPYDELDDSRPAVSFSSAKKLTRDNAKIHTKIAREKFITQCVPAFSPESFEGNRGKKIYIYIN